MHLLILSHLYTSVLTNFVVNYIAISRSFFLFVCLFVVVVVFVCLFFVCFLLFGFSACKEEHHHTV